MILIINTSQQKNQLALSEKSGKIVKVITWQGQRQSQLLLLKIDQLLVSHHQKPKDLSGIIVFSGPGSFTGLRVGISVANTFGFAMNIPVIGINQKQLPLNWKIQDLLTVGLKELPSKFQPIEPFYSQSPKITLPKKNHL